jgi:hypothetical protein
MPTWVGNERMLARAPDVTSLLSPLATAGDDHDLGLTWLVMKSRARELIQQRTIVPSLASVGDQYLLDMVEIVDHTWFCAEVYVELSCAPTTHRPMFRQRGQGLLLRVMIRNSQRERAAHTWMNDQHIGS